MILILYTTEYREGGAGFAQVAQTLAQELKEKGYEEVQAKAVESKRAVLKELANVSDQKKQIDQLHFIGHSGMYGPMFGTTSFPEQFSPHEWREMNIPFADKGEAWFHCCRSARWFAPFFARTQKVPAHGYHWYTAFSRDKTRYIPAWKIGADKPLYAIGCPGRTSHGLSASLRKYLGMTKAEEWQTFEPEPVDGDDSYDSVARLYDQTFADIKVREAEWKWISEHFPAKKGLRVLDIGCGNGALLEALQDRIGSGVGVDSSKAMLHYAEPRKEKYPHLNFLPIDGPELPFSDNSFDVVLSLLSFRYLDWDPMMKEINRVLAPGGRLLIVDMVAAPVGLSEMPRLIRDKLQMRKQHQKYPEFQKNLAKMVAHPDWKTMLKYNPIRAQHEFRWYLESRFPGRKAEVLNIGKRARVLAFDSGTFSNWKDNPITYP